RDSQPGARKGEFAFSSSLLARVLSGGTAMLMGDALSDPALQPTGSLLRSGTRSVLAAPLASRGDTLGVLYADRTDVADAFTPEDRPLFGALATIGATALAADRYSVKLEQESVVRAHLARYLAPELVEEVVTGRLSWQPGGELKEVTVLFSDVRGFTAASEKLSPQDVVASLNDYFALMVEEVFREGGTLDKFVGDAIMAVWGSPLGRETDPLSAVRAAVGMQRAVGAFNVRQVAAGRPPISMGVGINTGPAVAGNIGAPRRMDYTVIGDTVNLASRIESQTGPGQIFIGEATFQRIKGQMPVRPMGPIAVKGRTQPAWIYEITFETSEPRGVKATLPRPVHCRMQAGGLSFTALLSDIASDGLTLAARVDDRIGDRLLVSAGEADPGVECDVASRYVGTDSKGRKVQILTLRAAPAALAGLERSLLATRGE
ncbi:MAG: GAF domain-containing protein, partial [Candidatus Wallbacteria bacterium]|nr:GAF domain-containing protein [Candidatus Wallbacteria bacterium]